MSTDATTTADSTTVATTTPAPKFADWRKPDGSLNHESFKDLPEDIRYLGESLSKYKTDVDLFRGIAHQQTMAGKKGLIPLPDNAPKEVLAERKLLLDSINGVPKEAKDYGFTRPQDLPEALWSDQQAEAFSKWAHEHSVGPAAAKKLVALQTEFVKAQALQQEAYVKEFFDTQAKAFETEVRTANIPLDRANALAERGATALGLDLTKKEHSELLKNASVRLMAMRHAQAVGEDGFVAGDSSKGEGNDAMALAQDATHNKANPLYEPLHDPSHPQHRMAKEKLDGLWRQAAAKQKR